MVAMSIGSQAYATHHVNSWLRCTLSMPVASTLTLDAEGQYRMQNSLTNLNPVDKNLLVSFRTWIHYQKNESWKYSVSPLAYFNLYTPVWKDGEQVMKTREEYRVSAAVAYRKPACRNLFLSARAAAEYRMFSDIDDVFRVRFAPGLQIALNPSVYVYVYDELLMNLSGVTQKHLYDHNRTGAIVGYKPGKHFKLEAGYIYISRMPLTNIDMQYEDNFILHMTYSFKR